MLEVVPPNNKSVCDVTWRCTQVCASCLPILELVLLPCSKLLRHLLLNLLIRPAIEYACLDLVQHLHDHDQTVTTLQALTPCVCVQHYCMASTI